MVGKQLTPNTTVGRLLALGLALALAAGCASPKAASSFQAHVDYLASDDLEGRAIGTPGIDLAADYIADHFKALGLEPGGENGTFFQTFQMAKRKELGNDTHLALSGVPVGVSRDVDYVPLSFTSADDFDGQVVFCGYGIEDDEHDRHDYARVDVSDKVVLILRGEPDDWADDDRPTLAASFRTKAYAARERGAAAVLFVSQSPPDGVPDDLLRFDGSRPDAYGIPAFYITRKLADKMIEAGSMDDLDELQRRLDGGTSCSADVSGVRANGKADLKVVKADVRNVIGIVRGVAPYADQYVVIGAHYDHLGKVVPMQRKFKAGRLVRSEPVPQIHNGADDNASGTAGVIELARRFSSGRPPKRSVAFVAFTAEETGLHGSEYFVNHTPLPGFNESSIDQGDAEVVAILNMDMIGRLPEDGSLEVFGVDSGKEFRAILDKHASRFGLKIGAVGATSGRTDDASFYRRDVPGMHFCTGTHADYHKPSDDADKINSEGGARVFGLVGAVADDLASADSPPTYVAGLRTRSMSSDTRPGYRVVMGLTPGFAEDGIAGMKVQDVSPDGPAEVAGMKPGDRIVRIGKIAVNNIYDYMGALSKNKPADQVEVEVTRNGRNVVLTVTVAPAR